MGKIIPPVSVTLVEVIDDGDAWKVFNSSQAGIPLWIPKSSDFEPKVGSRVDMYCRPDYTIYAFIVDGHRSSFWA